MNFENSLGKLSCGTPPSNHFSHDGFFFFLFTDQGGLQPKINFLGGAKIKGKRNSPARSILCSYGNQLETLLSNCSHTFTHLGILIAGEVEEKEEMKNFLMWGEFFFHNMVDCEIFRYVKNKK